ncbi:MAG TPA: hypothetical protein EYN66_01390 [Myxococcales bacterium]|nr:hypothetical protein [Myxococcales bacterium]
MRIVFVSQIRSFQSGICVVALLTFVLAGCELSVPPAPPPDLDSAYFACSVQPVLARECSFPGCHGNPDRAFQVLAPARMRLSDQYLVARALLTPDELIQKVNPPLTETELAFNLNQSRFMIRPYDAPQDTQLLTRSLSVAAGGIYHAPNGDIFHSKKDEGYRRILAWINGAGAGDCP